ncbi:polysaccharide lyase family 7 protein [Aquimarina algiphila]|uniref:polysaccharide lyase family 7 protein n=1 Tax=Aquimarina algiphila TaxID=2047982 RepID=UPI00232D400E|nr:polysaccharide lyase family 7 protein [Aquimarina algiphila]
MNKKKNISKYFPKKLIINKIWSIQLLLGLFLLISNTSCQKDNSDAETPQNETVSTDENDNTDQSNPVSDNFKLPEIDLNHWKVTLPIGNPTEVKPPAILAYATNETLKPFMYNDSIDGSLVFYTYPSSSTANSSYSRTELREQMVPGSNNTNWTFAQGGRMKGTLAMNEITKDNDGKYHRAIIMQIHGRLTDAQRDLIGEDDNNAPPILKIYWNQGKVRVKTKNLKNQNVSETEILKTDAWTDDEGHTFKEEVGFEKFTLEVKVSEGRMEIILNENETVVYDDINIQKWGIFENYFKAGNYLITRDEGSNAKVKYYNLEVFH